MSTKKSGSATKGQSTLSSFFGGGGGKEAEQHDSETSDVEEMTQAKPKAATKKTTATKKATATKKQPAAAKKATTTKAKPKKGKATTDEEEGEDEEEEEDNGHENDGEYVKVKGSGNNDDDEEETDGAEESDVAMVDATGPVDAPVAAVNKKLSPDASNLPPISSIPDIFADLVRRCPQIKEVAQHLNGRPLRVATMCSGTESPLLALGLIGRSMKEQFGLGLEVEHVFSCEIEPFKQAYIERNFRPPILFRDVCELGDEQATTAYGSLVDVPGNVDILIAGTSCVDYSTLNNSQQTIEAEGESGRTFRGMMSWVRTHRPPIVILENVCGAPWEKVKGFFAKEDYSADFMRVDTKDFYIPHTRTRVYLMAIDKKGSGIPTKWKSALRSLARPASVNLDAFMLPGDDPRIHTAREKLVQERTLGLDRRTGRVDWHKCESRHHRARLGEMLGDKRPLTGWEDGGVCRMPDYAWNDWGTAQVERVWDLMDITILRSAMKGYDPCYKTLIWNLSQNVDRAIGSSRMGVSPCLTPTMIPYITNRGGPMVGLEALSLQGLPVDELLLTRETEDQLADLAGNAMSSTVVGAAMLIALTLGIKFLQPGEPGEEKAKLVEVEENVEERITGDEVLTTHPLDLSPTHGHTTGSSTPPEPLSLQTILLHATRSARYCDCEGRSGRTDRGIQRCVDCGVTTCLRCGGRPEHNYVILTPDEIEARISPDEFAKEVKGALPMALRVQGVTRELLDSIRGSSAARDIPDKTYTTWRTAVLDACSRPLRFVLLKRQEVWTAVYESPGRARAELVLHPQKPEWRLYAIPAREEGANSQVRKMLADPVGRLVLRPTGDTAGLLDGEWDFALPLTSTVELAIRGTGKRIPSWEHRLGLQETKFKNGEVWEKIEVKVIGGQEEDEGRGDDEDVEMGEDEDGPKDKKAGKGKGLLDCDVSGTYVWLERCGTANSGLHKRIGPVNSDTTDEDTSMAVDDANPSNSSASFPPNEPALFFFLDPTRCGEVDDDQYAFSFSIRRYQYGEMRPVIVRVDKSWRQGKVNVKGEAKKFKAATNCLWVRGENVGIEPVDVQGATYSIPSGSVSVDLSQPDACKTANAVLVCKVPIDADDASETWPINSRWAEVDAIHERTTFQELAWLVERIRSVGLKGGDEWLHLDAAPTTADGMDADGSAEKRDTTHAKAGGHDPTNCERCAPTPPVIKWTKSAKGKIQAIEDFSQAGLYEQALKHRPSPFVTQLRLDKDTNVGTVRVGINIASLVHRAYSRLPRGPATPKLSWRLTTEYTAPITLSLPKFNIIGNRLDPEHAQPPHFVTMLRPEQLRSLDWMIRQELDDAKPFVEEEISEAVLEPLGWRVEGKAEREHHVRGGVLADAVGYGKTAITLGLIDCSPGVIAPMTPATRGTIPVRATLVIVPPHLTRQWASEINKFADDHFKIVVIHSATGINAVTIREIQNADVVIVASNLFKSSVYLNNLDSFAASGPLPANEGRYFSARLEHTLASLRKQVSLLKKEGPTEVLEQIKKIGNAEEADAFVATKRLKGKQYRDAAEGQKKQGKAKDVANNSETDATSKAATAPSDTEMEGFEIVPSPPASRMSPASGAESSAASSPKDDVTSSSAATSPTSHPVSESAAASNKKRKFIVEVSLPSRPSKKPKLEASGANDFDPHGRQARKAAKAAIIISDDDSDEVDAPRPTKVKASVGKKKKSAPAKRKLTPESEDDAFIVSDDHDEDDDFDHGKSSESGSSVSDGEISDIAEEDKPKGRKKAPPKPKKAPLKKAPPKKAAASKKSKNEVASGEEGNGKKKKAAKETKPKASRADSDPWKLKSKDVQANWRKMHAPPLEMFHWHRVVVDEYTYLDGKSHTLITSLNSTCRWVLSGTPPIHDFAAIKTIAVFLGIHLGVDDDGEGNSIQVKKRKREQTAVERFHSFREVHSLDWHAHRHQVGQTFLDQFLRQNVAEIDEIPRVEHVERIILPAAERAIYLELEHHLRALDMVIKKGKKTESDREKRLAQSLGESDTAEEALLKRCSHFDLDPKDQENAMKACEVIVQDRTKQLEDCKAELLQALRQTFYTAHQLRKRDEDSPFKKWLADTKASGVQDKDATDVVLALIEAAKEDPLKSAPKTASSSSKKDKGKDDDDLWWEHREQTHVIRRLVKECTGRVRSLRYFTVVRDLQDESRKDSAVTGVNCPQCGKTDLPVSDIAVLSSCGHMGCHSCVFAKARDEECVYKASTGCAAAARVLNVVKAETLGVDDLERDGKGRHFGQKLEEMIKLIQKRIPKEERVLIFVQFPDLMKKVATALEEYKIKFLEIRGTAPQKSKNLEKFQADDSKERVLLLNVMDESASGANLTSANHAIFVSPLLTPTQQIYEANETQAIGRLQRYGQTKLVHIWRFITLDSIDVEIYQNRTGTAL